MRTSDRVNISAVALFDQSLDQYEATMETIKVNPNLFSGPAQYFQMALNRLITSNIPDAFQMMRSLTKRILTGNKAYSEQSLLMISSGTINNVFRDELMTIAYGLLNLTRGIDPNFDAGWLSRVNGNTAIYDSLNLYKTSALYKIQNAHKDNILTADLPVDIVSADSQNVILSITPKEKEINLASLQTQVLNFSLGEGWVTHPDHRHDLPTIYQSKVTVKVGVKEFLVPKTVGMSDLVKALCTSLGCLDVNSLTTNYYHFKIPAPFFSCVLEIASFDSGSTWSITNVQIIPPSLRKL